MARWTLTIEGEAEEFQEVLGTLQRLLSQAGAGVHVPEEAADSSRWTAEEFARFWGGLKRGAKAALREIANRPTGYATSDLEVALGKKIRSIGPELSSVGHQMRNFAKKPYPYMRDATTGWNYVLASEEIAEFIRSLADAEQ